MKKMNQYCNYLLLMLIGLSLFSSCDIINAEEEIPAYISIDTFKLNTIASTQGPNNHKITDAWISINGDFVGVFELPCKVPVLASGATEVFVKPGIKNNGIAASRLKYPFYTNYTVDVDLNPLDEILIEPSVQYYDEVIFDWFENFSEQGNTLDTLFGSTVDMEYINYNGSKAGRIRLVEDDDFFRAETIESFEFPPVSKFTLYLEMDYTANNPFTVGLYILSSGSYSFQPIIYMNPIEYMNKIYIDLSHYSQTMYTAEKYWVYIEAAKSNENEVGEIIFDNLKLVHL